jgi:predicted RNase H-like HicB family nuclease
LCLLDNLPPLCNNEAMEYKEAMERAKFTIQIRREVLSAGEGVYVALCLELDIASQGDTVEQAKANVTDAVEAFFEVASPSEIERRLPFRLRPHSDLFLTSIEVSLGQTARPVGAGSL